jgi:hypothetical protein
MIQYGDLDATNFFGIHKDGSTGTRLIYPEVSKEDFKIQTD